MYTENGAICYVQIIWNENTHRYNHPDALNSLEVVLALVVTLRCEPEIKPLRTPNRAVPNLFSDSYRFLPFTGTNRIL